MTNSRQKGKVGEREVATILRENGFSDARRGAQYHGGPDSPDVVCESLPVPTHIEVKFKERLNIHDAMAQSMNDCAPGKMPVVWHRRKRGDWMVTMPADAYCTIMNALAGAAHAYVMSQMADVPKKDLN